MQRRSLSLNVVAILLCIFRYFHCMTDQCMLLVYDVCFGCTFTWFCRNRKFILLVLFIFFSPTFDRKRRLNEQIKQREERDRREKNNAQNIWRKSWSKRRNIPMKNVSICCWQANVRMLCVYVCTLGANKQTSRRYRTRTTTTTVDKPK